MNRSEASGSQSEAVLDTHVVKEVLMTILNKIPAFRAVMSGNPPGQASRSVTSPPESALETHDSGESHSKYSSIEIGSVCVSIPKL